jgi:predicted GNAT family acetyltransferase
MNDTSGKENLEIRFNEQFPSASDVVFGLMFEERELLEPLIESVTGKPHTLTTISAQLHIRDELTLSTATRFDIASESMDNWSFAVDMQRRLSLERNRARTVYYMCRDVSRQKVMRSMYERLHPVAITFIHTSINKEIREAGTAVNHASLMMDSGKQYSDLLHIYEVYVPIGARSEGIDRNLKTFCEFFALRIIAIESQAGADKFLVNTKTILLAG